MQETKENRDECKRLLKLCSNQAFFPADAAIRKLLVDALIRSAKSAEHAGRCIMRWIEVDSISVIEGQQRSVAPNVSDMIRLCAAVNPNPRPAPTTACEACQRTPGWIIREYVDARGETVSSAARCRCGAIPAQVQS